MSTTVDRRSSDEAILSLLHRVADAVHGVLAATTDWSLSGVRRTQYSVDLAADAAALELLHGAGCAVLSEESRVTGERQTDGLIVVMDPLDGSTNASRGVPWYATALCALDEEGPRVAVVANQADGRRWWAMRGGGAYRDGEPISPSGCASMSDAVVGVSGRPSVKPGWAQFRALGAAALDICLVADGTTDGWVDFNRHGVWDYLAASMICREAGAVVADFEGRDEVTTDYDDTHTIVVAATTALLEPLLDLRRRHALS